jgi:NitT/TauT family transport system ATP-binding protein
VAQGEFVALVGPTGCGKTTILNLIAGIARPSGGIALVNGRPPVLPNLDIGYMFARDALYPWRTAIKNVELSLEARRGVSKSERRQRAGEMLDLVGLADKKHLYRLQLSQGMRQRTALARTLAPKPSILLMDEPFGALDARTKLQLQSQLLHIWESSAQNSQTPTTVVFVTHDLQEAALLADRVVVMAAGPGRMVYQQVVDLPRPRAGQVGKLVFDDRFRDLHRTLFENLESALSVTGASPMLISGSVQK